MNTETETEKPEAFPPIPGARVMQAHLLTTPETNVNHETGFVIDNNLLRKLKMDWGQEVIIFDTVAKAPTPEIRPIAIEHISTYDHRLMVQGEKYRVVHMLSKPKPQIEEEEPCYGY